MPQIEMTDSELARFNASKKHTHLGLGAPIYGAIGGGWALVSISLFLAVAGISVDAFPWSMLFIVGLAAATAAWIGHGQDEAFWREYMNQLREIEESADSE